MEGIWMDRQRNGRSRGFMVTTRKGRKLGPHGLNPRIPRCSLCDAPILGALWPGGDMCSVCQNETEMRALELPTECTLDYGWSGVDPPSRSYSFGMTCNACGQMRMDYMFRRALWGLASRDWAPWPQMLCQSCWIIYFEADMRFAGNSKKIACGVHPRFRAEKFKETIEQYRNEIRAELGQWRLFSQEATSGATLAPGYQPWSQKSPK